MNSVEKIEEFTTFFEQSGLFELDKTESNLMRSIDTHKHNILTIEKASGPSRRTQFLREEVERLEIELQKALE